MATKVQVQRNGSTVRVVFQADVPGEAGAMQQRYLDLHVLPALVLAAGLLTQAIAMLVEAAEQFQKQGSAAPAAPAPAQGPEQA